MMVLVWSPIRPLRKFLPICLSLLQWPMIGSIAERRFNSFFDLAVNALLLV
jgi:hypothetical protein